MKYTIETMKPNHVGLKVKWHEEDGKNKAWFSGSGTGMLVYRDNDSVNVFSDSSLQRGYSNLWCVHTYELLPMPLKEAYERGLLKVGQRIREKTTSCGFISVITKVLDTEIETISEFFVGEVEHLNYDYGWMVEIVEEPKESEVIRKEEKKEEGWISYKEALIMTMDDLRKEIVKMEKAVEEDEKNTDVGRIKIGSDDFKGFLDFLLKL